MPKRYVVTAPYVTLTTMTTEGRRLLGFHTGAPVPDDVSEDQIRYHLRDGLIEEVGAPPKPAPPPEPETPKAEEPKVAPKPPAGKASGG